METTADLETRLEADAPLTREQLVTENLRLVHHVARQLVRTRRDTVDFDDLVSAGTIGLINAVDNFDPSRGLRFSTFAAPRIRGAILDDLRKRDHVPRSVRKKQRELARAHDTLATALDREPTEREMANELGVEVEKLWRWRREAEYASRVSLNQPTETAKGPGVTPEQLLSGDDEASADAIVNRKEEVDLLREEILSLKEQERLVISLYYFEELKLHEIATILGVTESRVSQIRTKAIGNLRGRLSELRSESCA